MNRKPETTDPLADAKDLYEAFPIKADRDRYIAEQTAQAKRDAESRPKRHWSDHSEEKAPDEKPTCTNEYAETKVYPSFIHSPGQRPTTGRLPDLMAHYHPTQVKAVEESMRRLRDTVDESAKVDYSALEARIIAQLLSKKEAVRDRIIAQLLSKEAVRDRMLYGNSFCNAKTGERIPPEEAQIDLSGAKPAWLTAWLDMPEGVWVEGKHFQVEEVCRAFGVPYPVRKPEQLDIDFGSPLGEITAAAIVQDELIIEVKVFKSGDVSRSMLEQLRADIEAGKYQGCMVKK